VRFGESIRVDGNIIDGDIRPRLLIPLSIFLIALRQGGSNPSSRYVFAEVVFGRV
jgi:hypothetical protein